MGAIGPRRQEAGFILVSVLLALALLSAIAIALSHRAGTLARTAQAETMAIAAQARVDGIVRLIAFRLADRTFANQWRRNAEPLSCRLEADVVTIEVIDAGGLVDLNAAPAGLLAALLRGVGVDREQTEKLASAIVAFRGTSSPDEDGRTLAAYAAAGLTFGPKLAPFETVAELDQVLGLDPGLVAALRPFVTVGSRLPGLDPLVAPGSLLAALGRAEPGNDGAAYGMPPALQIRSAGRAFVVRVRLYQHGGAIAGRDAAVDLSSTSAAGTIIRDWSIGARSEADQRTASSLPGGDADCRAMFAEPQAP